MNVLNLGEKVPSTRKGQRLRLRTENVGGAAGLPLHLAGDKA